MRGRTGCVSCRVEAPSEWRFHPAAHAAGSPSGVNRRKINARPTTRSIPMPKTIKVGVITQAQGAHLPDYFGSLARIEEAESVALADPSEKTVDMARKALGDKLKEV